MTGTTITPYLMFGGRCEEALDFYRQALGAEVEMVLRFNESPQPTPAEPAGPSVSASVGTPPAEPADAPRAEPAPAVAAGSPEGLEGKPG